MKTTRSDSKSKRPWGIRFDLAYDSGGEEWTQYYRTKIGARISAWFQNYVASWGGTAIMFDNRKKE